MSCITGSEDSKCLVLNESKSNEWSWYKYDKTIQSSGIKTKHKKNNNHNSDHLDKVDILALILVLHWAGIVPCPWQTSTSSWATLLNLNNHLNKTVADVLLSLQVRSNSQLSSSPYNSQRSSHHIIWILELGNFLNILHSLWYTRSLHLLILLSTGHYFWLCTLCIITSLVC